MAMTSHATALLDAGTTPAPAARPPRVGLPRAPRLSTGPDPSREVAVSWETDGPVEAPACELLGPEGPAHLVAAVSRAVDGTRTVYHHAWLRGLAPGTTYRYRPRQRGAGGRAGCFTTAPSSGPVRLTAFGDQGTGPEAAVSTARVAALEPQLHLHLGDLCYADPTGTGRGGPPDQSIWDAWSTLATSQAARAPWVAIAGNHEMEPGHGPQGYDGLHARLVLPGNGVRGAPHTWWLRLGGLAIVGLDGNDWSSEHLANRDWTGGAQEGWLADVLATLDADPDVTHVVVAVHGCPFSANAGHGSDLGLRERLVPLVDAHDVALVLSGHNHAYERTHALRGGAVAATVPMGGRVRAGTGTVYVVAGAGGHAPHPTFELPTARAWTIGGRVPDPAAWHALGREGTSVVVLDHAPAEPDGAPAILTLRCLAAASGDVLDELTLEGRRR